MATFENRSVVVSDTEGNNAAVTPAGALTTDGSGVTQPVSAASLPLPTGASTEATLALIKAKTDNLDVALSTRAVTGLTDAQLRASAVPVSAASLPLPTGSATSALQTTGNSSLSSIDTKTPALVGGRQPVDGSGVTQPISAASLPLPTGAATAALQTQPGVDIGDVTVNNAAGAAAVNIQDGGNSITVDGPLTDAELRASAVPVSAAALPLPTGAATEATLATRAAASQLPAALVGGRLDENVGAWLGSTAPTVGQKTMAASLPVALASDQSAVPISAASLPLPTGAATSANQTTLGNQTTKINDGTNTAAVKAASTAAVAADPALVVAVSPNNIIAVKGNAADGAAVSGNPNLVAGSDGTTARTLATTNTGVLKVVEVGSRVLVGSYGCGTGVINGTALAQNIVSIENPSLSGKTVYVKRFHITATAVAAAGTSYRYVLGRTTAVPTAGTVLTAQKRATADAAPVAIVRSGPTATAATGSYWSGAGVIAPNSASLPLADLDALRELRESDDIVLAAGEGLLLIAEANDTDLRHTVALCWEEA